MEADIILVSGWVAFRLKNFRPIHRIGAWKSYCLTRNSWLKKKCVSCSMSMKLPARIDRPWRSFWSSGWTLLEVCCLARFCMSLSVHVPITSLALSIPAFDGASISDLMVIQYLDVFSFRMFQISTTDKSPHIWYGSDFYAKDGWQTSRNEQVWTSIGIPFLGHSHITVFSIVPVHYSYIGAWGIQIWYWCDYEVPI